MFKKRSLKDVGEGKGAHRKLILKLGKVVYKNFFNCYREDDGIAETIVSDKFVCFFKQQIGK